MWLAKKWRRPENMITGYRVMKLLLIPLKVRPAIISWLRLKMPKDGDWHVVCHIRADQRYRGQWYLYVLSMCIARSCGKQIAGHIPLFTEKVSVFYRGTFITGEEFDGNFDGFGATDREIPLPLSDPLSENSPESKWPTAFNSPSELWYPKLLQAGHGFAIYAGR